MADYIEDPQIAASIDDIKRRWPEIGAAADHPLTEFFLTRQHTRKRTLNNALDAFKEVLLVAVICVGVWYFLPKTMNFLALWIFWGISFAFRIVKRNSKPSKQYNLINPVQFLTGVGDKSQWEQIWMLPVGYSDIAGMYLACGYHSRRINAGKQRLFRGSIWAFAIVGAIYYLGQIFDLKFFLPPFFILIASLNRILQSEQSFLRSQMTKLPIMLARGRHVSENSNIEWFMAFAIFVGFINFILFMLFLDQYELLIDCSMLAWGCFFFWISFLYRSWDLDASFRQLVRDEKEKYKEMICKILSANEK